MTAAELRVLLGEFWPYAVVIFIGFLPTEVWRTLAVVVAKDMREDSDVLMWVRLVATTLLAAVVAKMIAAPTGVLASVPLWGRIFSLSGAVAMLFLSRRSVIAAVLTGEVLLIASYFVL